VSGQEVQGKDNLTPEVGPSLLLYGDEDWRFWKSRKVNLQNFALVLLH
jgi:hypothetical protein